MHEMTNGDPCGWPDGHGGHHRAPATVDRKRAYDRERVAKLYEQGQTWWQQRGDWGIYDMYRTSHCNYRVRLCERIARGSEQLAEMSGVANHRVDEDRQRIDQAKRHGRRAAHQGWQHGMKQRALEREHGPCEYGPPERRMNGTGTTFTLRRCVNPAHDGLHSPS
jgi:hypothetical protein